MSDVVENAREALGAAFKAFRRRAGMAQAFQRVYATPEGKTVLHHLLREGGVLSVAADPNDARFYDGKRALALEICQQLRWSESEMIALAVETTSDQLNELRAA